MNTVSLLKSGRRWVLALVVVTCLMTTLFAFPEFVGDNSEAQLDTRALAMGGLPGFGGDG